MVAVAFDWERCIDGVELYRIAATTGTNASLLSPRGGVYVRPKSSRCETMSLEFEGRLDDPLVKKFVEAAADTELLEFMAKYGIPSYFPDTGIQEEHFEDVREMQRDFSLLLKGRFELFHQGNFDLAARVNFWLQVRQGRDPTLVLKPQSLGHFMQLETAFLISKKQILVCAGCGALFLTGPHAKRNHSKYCSSSCRSKYRRKRS
jgi:hypothetical protein